MASLAGMLRDSGWEVSGCDQDVYPPMSTFLQEHGIAFYRGYDPTHLDKTPDLVVIGNVLSRGNPEVEAVLERKLPYRSLSEVLKEYFIRGKYSIVVCGTYGKTTTASLLAWVLTQSGQDPSFFVGGIPRNFGQGYRLGQGRYFVLEGDEYDSAFFDKRAKFLHYLPDLVIVQGIEYDHPDLYRDFEEYKLAFRRLVNIIPKNGFLLGCQDDPHVREVAAAAFCPVETFGLSSGADWRADNLEFSADGTQFDVIRRGECLGRIAIPLAGAHNVKNALSVIAALSYLGLPLPEIAEGLRSFQGVRRRLEVVGTVNGITVFDDFAHHPTEIQETVRGLRMRYPDRRLWAVFEPRSATTKRKLYEAQYPRAFEAADVVILAPLHRPDKVKPEERLSLPNVVQALQGRGKEAIAMPSIQSIVDHLAQHLQPGDIVLMMSNGDFDNLPRRVLEAVAGQPHRRR